MSPTSFYDLLPNSVVEQLDLVAGLACVVLVNVVGLALTRLRGLATRWLGLAGLCALLKLMWSQWLFTVRLTRLRR